eukprot:6515967-Pyramimonas_sp.AAC.1
MAVYDELDWGWLSLIRFHLYPWDRTCWDPCGDRSPSRRCRGVSSYVWLRPSNIQRECCST